MINKLKQIIGNPTKKMYLEKDIEIENAKIKNLTKAIATYGAQDSNFIGMLTLTFGNDNYERILSNDYLSTIKSKTKIMYYSILYYLNLLKKELNKQNFNLIYITSFELQKDGNLHSHIYFSLELKAFHILFDFYHNYNTNIITHKQTVKLNRKEQIIIPVGRTQLGIATQFKNKLEKEGFEFESYTNPQNPNRKDYRCINLVNEQQFYSGKWPTLFFYSKTELEKHYGEKIVKYLTKNYSKTTRQKVIGSQYIKHNNKIIDSDNDEWSNIQKQFIRKVCKRLYIASRLPIPIYLYQKNRPIIIETYSKYRNLNNLIYDLLNKTAQYKNYTLICPNGKSLKLK